VHRNTPQTRNVSLGGSKTETFAGRLSVFPLKVGGWGFNSRSSLPRSSRKRCWRAMYKKITVREKKMSHNYSHRLAHYRERTFSWAGKGGDLRGLVRN